MKKLVKLITFIIVIYFVTAITLTKFIPAATLESYSDSDEIYQTWEEFLESGVKIEYGEAHVIADDENDK